MSLLNGTDAAAFVNTTGEHNAEPCTIIPFLKDKTLLVTGATGFLAKVLVEKILFEQPDVKHLYLIIQPRKDITAEQRLKEQVLTSPVFNRLRQTHGEEAFEQLISEKVTAVAGNIGEEMLGMSPDVVEQVAASCNVLINSAATTSFDERYDTAININTLGPRNLLSVAKKCPDLELLMHVSTAFVNGLREGEAKEEPFAMGHSIRRELGDVAAPMLDVDREIALAQSAVEAARSRQLDSTAETEKLVELGTQRAEMFGWQDTYVFTKAMGEMILGAERENIPVAIVRPSIVESALSEPYKGWIEGIRMADPILIAYGKGQMRGFLANRDGVLDVIPVDTVINAMLAIMPRLAHRDTLQVYHVATSVANPLVIDSFVEFVSDHFKNTPMVDKEGNPIEIDKMSVFPNKETFALDAWLRYKLPTQTSKLLQPLGVKPGPDQRKRDIILKKIYEQMEYFGRIYASYTFYKCRFSVSKIQAISEQLSPAEREKFPIDIQAIDWREYLSDIHIPGLKKFVLKGRA